MTEPKIVKYKMLILSTGVIQTYSVQETINSRDVITILASLNNNPRTYGVVYYFDNECIESKFKIPA